VDSQLFRCKDIDQLISDSENPEKRLKKTLGWISLTALGIGAIIGTGIFILTGTAAAGEEVLVPSILKAPVLDVLLHGTHALGASGRPGAGPAIAVSFFLVAIVCGFAGLCYAELASMIPIAGSAYTYTYATMGELTAWIIGWDLILEYAVSNMAVAVGFSAYVNSLLNSLGIHLPDALSTPAYQPMIGWLPHFNLVGFLIVMLLTVLLVTGIKESATSNSIMVGIKLVAIFVFVVFASKYINPINWTPFAPNGFQGILTGGAIVFFSYIGFDSVSTAAEECKNPKRDLPLGIMASLLICAALYVGVAIVLTGIQPYNIYRGDRRTDGYDLLAACLPIRPGARVVRDVSRWPATGSVQQGSQALSHSAFRHLDCRYRSGHSCGDFRYRHPRGSLEHRDTLRFRSRGYRGAGAAQNTA
jgi:basic amino acid/polyamine antiporter, APA family